MLAIVPPLGQAAKVHCSCESHTALLYNSSLCTVVQCTLHTLQCEVCSAVCIVKCRCEPQTLTPTFVLLFSSSSPHLSCLFHFSPLTTPLGSNSNTQASLWHSGISVGRLVDRSCIFSTEMWFYLSKSSLHLLIH